MVGKIFDPIPGADCVGKIVRLEQANDKMLVIVRKDGDTVDTTFVQYRFGRVITNDCVGYWHDFTDKPSGEISVVNCKH